jgi:hypothetical protein
MFLGSLCKNKAVATLLRLPPVQEKFTFDDGGELT